MQKLGGHELITLLRFQLLPVTVIRQALETLRMTGGIFAIELVELIAQQLGQVGDQRPDQVGFFQKLALLLDGLHLGQYRLGVLKPGGVSHQALQYAPVGPAFGDALGKVGPAIDVAAQLFPPVVEGQAIAHCPQ